MKIGFNPNVAAHGPSARGPQNQTTTPPRETPGDGVEITRVMGGTAAEPFAAHDLAIPHRNDALDPFVAEPLVRTLSVIMRDESRDRELQRPLAQEDQKSLAFR